MSGITFYIDSQFPTQTIKLENTSHIGILNTETAIRKNETTFAGIHKLPKFGKISFPNSLETIIGKVSKKSMFFFEISV